MIIANDPTVKGGTYFPLTVSQFNCSDNLRDLPSWEFRHPGEEALESPTNCSRKCSAVHLPCRIWRRCVAISSRGVPRSCQSHLSEKFELKY